MNTVVVSYCDRNLFSLGVSWCLALLTCGCGSSTGSPPSPVAQSPRPSTVPAAAPSPTTVVPSNATVAITAAGMNPREVTVASGGRVTFVNNDNQPHDVQGGPDPDHRDCLEIDAVGFLSPGQSRATNPLATMRTCDYHDHAFHAAGFDGRIIIQ